MGAIIDESQYIGGRVGFWLRRMEKLARYADRTNNGKKQRKAASKAREAYLRAMP